VTVNSPNISNFDQVRNHRSIIRPEHVHGQIIRRWFPKVNTIYIFFIDKSIDRYLQIDHKGNMLRKWGNYVANLFADSK